MCTAIVIFKSENIVHKKKNQSTCRQSYCLLPRWIDKLESDEGNIPG